MYFSMPAMPWLSMLTVPSTCAGGRAARIEATVLDAEADARNAELVDRLLLARRDLALDVGELGVGGEHAAAAGRGRGRERRRRAAPSPRRGRSRSAARRRARPCGCRWRASRRCGRRCRAAPARRRWMKLRAVVLLAVRGDAEQDQPRGEHAIEQAEAEPWRAPRAGGRGAPDRPARLPSRPRAVPPGRGGNDRRHCCCLRGSRPEFRGSRRAPTASSGAGPVGRIGRFSILVICVGSSGCSFRSSAWRVDQLLHARRLDEQAPFGLEQRQRLVLLIELALQLGGMLGDRFGPVLDLEHEDRRARRRDHRNDLQPARSCIGLRTGDAAELRNADRVRNRARAAARRCGSPPAAAPNARADWLRSPPRPARPRWRVSSAKVGGSDRASGAMPRAAR